MYYYGPILRAEAEFTTMKAVTDPNSLANLPECVPRAPSGYPGGQCVVTIDRQLPISPPALLVPPGTDVFVKVIKTRGNEAVLFSLATTHTTPPDVAGAAVKNLITPLQSLVFVQTSTHLNYEGGEQPADKIDKEEDEISRTLTAVQKVVRQATAALTCLSNYQELQANDTCSQAKLLTPSSFPNEKKTALKWLITAIRRKAGLPTGNPDAFMSSARAALRARWSSMRM